ncbi:hypothetical protein GGR23_004338 [Gellertiella hungarica]|uniref:Ribbon-helix-helix protein CopG domain-containing protein n=1 Tax=Gellertiella hungarica TaxID=1572859 RepID=A0A7W6J970_9HYPH|nr:hypothetical protein [Gellertiella hungarica]
MKNAALGIRIDADVKAALAKAARQDRRSVASYVEKLIVEDLTAKGLIDGEAK